MERIFPTIDLVETGKNIVRLRRERGLTVRDLQGWFNFEEPRAIYKWQSGQTLPSVDNLFALSALLDVPMNEILVSASTRERGAASDGGGSNVYSWVVAVGLALIRASKFAAARGAPRDM